MAEKFNGTLDFNHNHAQEVSFFLGRINDRNTYERVVYGPYFSMPPSLREPRSFDKEERMYNMGQRYPFLDDDELDYLEELYCSSDTYDMINRMLYDGDDFLRRRLARFDSSLYNISNSEFSKKFCLEVFNALITNYTEYDIEQALDDRHQPVEDKIEEARLWGYSPTLEYPTILVYNRRTNSIQIDNTDLSDRFLIPIANFGWANMDMSLPINLFIDKFGEDVKDNLYDALSRKGLNKQMIQHAMFCVPWYLALEKTIIERKEITPKDYRIIEIHESIARIWLKYQNEKSLR